MKPLRVVLLSLLLAAAALGQNIPVNLQPDCLQNFNLFNQVGGTLNVQMDNRFTLCDTWVVVYMSVGYTGVTITFQSANDANGTPGAFAAFSGIIASGVNPMVSLTASRLVVTGYNPWVRANVVTVGASGTLNGSFYGYRTTPASTGASSGCASPCPVIGTAAAGTPPSGAPVQTGGSDGANIRTFLTDTSGRQISVGAAAAGAAPVSNPVLEGGTDGAAVRAILTDASGRQNAVGAAASGAAVAGNPVLVGGQDGANARSMLTDPTGRPSVTGTNATAPDGLATNANVTLSSNGGIGSLMVSPYTFNGASQYNRVREAGVNSMPVATSLTGRNAIGVQIGEPSSHWAVVSNPAAGSQASASIAAEAGVRHILNSACFSAASTTAPVLTALTVNVRDGASGAGTIIHTFQVAISAATGQNVAPFCTPDGMSLVGTTNTAMTLEFSAALANLIESVSISGYNVN